MAYPRRADRGASTVAVVAPPDQRRGRFGRRVDAGLDGRARFRVRGAVAPVGGNGAVLVGADPRPSSWGCGWLPGPCTQAVAAGDGRYAVRGLLRRLLRGGHRHL